MSDSVLQAICIWGLGAGSWAQTNARGLVAGEMGVSETKWKPPGWDWGIEAPVHHSGASVGVHVHL